MVKTNSSLKRIWVGLFIIQIFSTIPYAVLYSSLIFFLTFQLGVSDGNASAIMASFFALAFALHLASGYICGKYISNRHMFMLGSVVSAFSFLILLVNSKVSMTIAISIYIVGFGLIVTCVNNMITQHFTNDAMREKVFLWNYSGMNIGFFVGIFMCGFWQLNHQYNTMFIFAFIFSILTIVLMLFFWKDLGEVDTSILKKTKKQKSGYSFYVYLLMLILSVIFTFLINYTEICTFLVSISAVGVFFVIGTTIKKLKGLERNKMIVFLILFIASLVYWSLYQVAPMGLNLFIANNVDLNVFGLRITPQWVQNMNNVIIVFGGPILAVVFEKLRKRGFPISTPLQFSCALFFIGIAYALLPFGILSVGTGGYVNFSWIFLCYVSLSVGELFIGPIGYSIVGKLVPKQSQSFMMGIWLMVMGIASVIAGYLSQLATVKASNNPLTTNPEYLRVFGGIGIVAIIAAFILLSFKKKLDNLLVVE